MNDLLFTANAVLPIVILIAIGYILKRMKLLPSEFMDAGNKLTYRLFLPVLLFYNVCGIKDFGAIDWYFVLYGVVGVIVVFAVSLGAYCLFVKDNGRRGVLIQAAFRSNYAIIGIPLASALFGESGAATATVMSAFTIPLFNVLAVVTLSVFNGRQEKARIHVGKILLGIVTNPLIIGVACGLLFVGARSLLQSQGVAFDLADIGFIYAVIKSLAGVATPLALIILGGQFRFSAVKAMWKPILAGTVVRTVIVPAVALSLAAAVLGSVTGEQYATFIAVFGTPVAVSSAVLAKEMGCDDELAGQLVVWTTIASAFTVFLTVLTFRMVGIF